MAIPRVKGQQATRIVLFGENAFAVAETEDDGEVALAASKYGDVSLIKKVGLP